MFVFGCDLEAFQFWGKGRGMGVLGIVIGYHPFTVTVVKMRVMDIVVLCYLN